MSLSSQSGYIFPLARSTVYFRSSPDSWNSFASMSVFSSVFCVDSSLWYVSASLLYFTLFGLRL